MSGLIEQWEEHNRQTPGRAVAYGLIPLGPEMLLLAMLHDGEILARSCFVVEEALAFLSHVRAEAITNGDEIKSESLSAIIDDLKISVKQNESRSVMSISMKTD